MKMILCWLQLHVFAVAELFQISVCLRCPFSSPFSTSSQAVYKPNDWGHCREQSCVLQDPGVGLQGGLSSTGAESSSAASAAAATAFCFGMHGKRTAVSLQNGAKLAANWHTVSTEDTTVHSASPCCLGAPGALGSRGRSAAK